MARKLLFLLFVFGGGLTASSQSTLASLNGTVHDATGAVVPNATVVLHRQQSDTNHTVSTGADGSFNALNLDPGTYSLHVTAPGFSATDAEGIQLDARQQLRYDVALSISGSTTVTVNATDAGTINTDNAQISAALSPEAVLDLPANYRGAGSTSPLNVVQTLPGVQPDSGSYPPSASSSPSPGIKFSIQGGLPSQSETTVDGISAQNQTNNNVQQDAFPSAESIAEIRVDGVNNNAEYGQPGEITTITKSGTNHIHGSLFEYFQNSALDAVPYQGNTTDPIKPKKVANDFGATIGGPVVIPHLYNGRNRTFFFGTYEGLRFPLATVLQARVPTALMKQGDFSQEIASAGTQLRNPFTGGTYAGGRLPSINPSSAAFLQFYPDPNVDPNLSLQDAVTANGYNYLSTRRQDINSNQFDARVDQNFGQKFTMFARYTFKDITQLQAQDLTLPYSNAIGNYRIFATSANYAFTPHLADEFRFGFTLEENGTVNPFNGAAAVAAAGFQGLPPAPFFNGLTHIGFDEQITSIGARLNSTERSRIFQYVDNLTWQHGGHVVRVGADVRHLQAITVLGFTPGDNYGNFFFNPSAATSTRQEFADFLLGVPYQTQYDNVNADNSGTTNAFAFYGQDNWKATPNLNLTFGLRYEYHPAFSDPGGNIGNFDPSVAKSGRLIYPAGHADRLSAEELANLNACPTAGVTNPYATGGSVNGAPCTPVVDNVAAGIPSGLRQAPKLRFEPRLGFAYRPFGNDKTVISGGAGYYNITTTGAIFYALTGTLQANQQSFTNVNTSANQTGPAIVFPNVSTAGTNSFASGNFSPAYGSSTFYAAVDIPWHDPYSLQTNLSVERDLGHGFGLRVSYIGLKTWHLVWQPELNQLQASNTTRAVDQPRSAFPFPNLYAVYDRNTEAQASYHSGQVEFYRRFSRGLSLSSTYTLAKNLADNQGTYGSYGVSGSFVDEQGGYNATDAYNRHLDYGNVSGTRRNRWLSTAVYELPVGRGKRFGGGMNRIADALVGGWQVSGIFVDQSGPFLTAFLESGYIDPAGTGSGTLYYREMRPDRIANANYKGHNRNQWVNVNAFACPGGVDSLGNRGYASLTHGACAPGTSYTDPNTGQQVAVAPIGRYGTESVGDVTGPGTVNLSTGLAKSFAFTEGVRLRAEGTFTNVLNHTNLADPNLDLNTSNFGQITQARGSDFGGNRTGQVSLRLEF